ncbi:MAG: hypothetical protein N3D09_01010, partial [Archaeoglobaceae archaeon]|nr:hypothetical protein [Archaeoglobaceae archaeon]
LDGMLKFYLDGKEIGESMAKMGTFSFSFLPPYIGKHKIDIKFKAPGYEPSFKSLEFEVVEAEKKTNVIRVVRLAFILLMLLIIALFLSLFIIKQF